MIRDERGLYLRVDPSGRKYWILRYWEAKREHQISLGPYPDIGLKDARMKRDEIQTARAKGESPRRQTSIVTQHTLADVAQEWLQVRMSEKSPSYLRTIQLRLGKYIMPALGSWDIGSVTPGDVLRLCRRIEGEGHVETAKRVMVVIGQVFRFAIAAGYTDTDPTASLGGALQVRTERHFPTILDPREIGLLMRAMSAYPYPILRTAMLFSALTFARPGEVRHAMWAEFSTDIWDIPASKMKMRRRHIVPLATQVQELLAELRQYTGRSPYLFPSPRTDARPISQDTVRVTLRALGYTKEQITPHGFRAMASTILHEQGFNPLVIERQLAHVQTNTVARAYNHAEYLDERRVLMQWWANWLYERMRET